MISDWYEFLLVGILSVLAIVGAMSIIYGLW
jgi:hypothetical protein